MVKIEELDLKNIILEPHINSISKSTKGTGLDEFIGVFGYKDNYFDLYLMQDYDRDWFFDVHNKEVKENEMILRCTTMTAEAGGISYLVKINLKEGRVYFPKQLEDDTKFSFERGLKFKFLTILESGIERYNEEGGLFSYIGNKNDKSFQDVSFLF